MPVNVIFRSAPVSAGAIQQTGQVFLAAMGLSSGGGTPHLCYSIADFEAAFGPRTTAGNAPAWDWCDAAFKEGVRQIWVASYAAAGGYASAFAMFDKEKGPGQLVVLGETPSGTVFADITAEAVAKNRFALLDVVDSSTLAAMQTLGDVTPVIGAAAESFMLAGPWLLYPPPSGVTGGTERHIPASALVAGIMARVEADGNPNRAPGGRDYPSQYADGVTLAFTATDRDAALTHKLNLVRLVNGVIQVDAAQTGIVQDPSTPFWQANCGRARMWAVDKAWRIGQTYYMKPIDAEGHLAGALKKDLVAMLMSLYAVDGLYGLTPQDAFDVNVGFQVNNPINASAATLMAVAQMKLSLYAKTVEVDLVSVPILGTVVNS